MKKLFSAFFAFILLTASTQAFAALSDVDFDPNDFNNTNLQGNTYVTQPFIDWLELNKAYIADAYPDALTEAEIDDLIDFFKASLLVKPERKNAFKDNGFLKNIAEGDIKDTDLDFSRSIDRAFVFVSDGEIDFLEEMSDLFKILDDYDTSGELKNLLPEGETLTGTSLTYAYIAGERTNDDTVTYDFFIPGNNERNNAIIPIDGGLSFLALGGIAFGAARFRRRKQA